ncbi:hypothetical protein ACTFIZ_011783 [Dictyostelium cf. discoideum]
MNTKEYYRNKNLKLLFLNFLEASSFTSLFIVFYYSKIEYVTLSIMLFLGSLFFFTRLLVILFHFHVVWPLLVTSKHLEYNNIEDIKDKINELNLDSNKVQIYYNGKDSNFEKYANIRLKKLICNQSKILTSLDQILNYNNNNNNNNNYNNNNNNNNTEFEKKINYINIKFKFNYSSNLIPNILEEFIKKYPNELIWPNRELFEIEKIGFNNNYLLCCTKPSNYSFKFRKVFNVISILFGVSWFYYYFSFYRNSNFNEIIIEKSIDTTYQQLLLDMNYNKILYDIGKQLIYVHNEQFKTKQQDDEEKEEIIVDTVLDIKQNIEDSIVDIVIVDDPQNCKQKTIYNLPLIESNNPVF